MPGTDFQSPSPSGLRFYRRRDQVHSMDPTTLQESDHEAFQRKVADRFNDLLNFEPNELLSITWISKLLNTFLSCQEDFRLIILNNHTHLKNPPMDKYISEFFDRGLKALDVCNAIRDGIEKIRQWTKSLEIILSALDNSQSIGEGKFRRAKKALSDLALAMLDTKESNGAAISQSHRNRSFGFRRHQNLQKSHFRSLSWSVSRTWSANRQLQAISSNLVAPRLNETALTNGLNVVVFTMNYVLVFVMWVLVAAIPCQDRGLPTQFYVGRQFVWAAPILLLHEMILEESKKRDRRNACGLLREIWDVEKCMGSMNGLMDTVSFPLTESNERKVRLCVEDVGFVYAGLKEGLDPLERLVREVFFRTVRIRTEGLDLIGRAS